MTTNMRKVFRFAVGMAMLVSASVIAAPPLPAQDLFEPVIKVNDLAITRYEIEQRARMLTLFRAPGDPEKLAREQLIEEVWGPQIAVTLRTIDTHLKRLREKLGTSADLIDTIRGVGYRFRDRPGET